MAIIPRFISKTPATPGISNAQVDPNTAAAPYRAAEQSTAHVFDVIGSELNAWDKTIKVKQAEQAAQDQKNLKVQEGLYKAQAMAQANIATNQIYQDAKFNATANSNLANDVDQQFQKVVDTALAGAPTDSSRLDLLKKFIGMRSSLYTKASNEQRGISNQAHMTALEDMLGQYEAIAASNPERAAELHASSEDIFKSLGDLGVPARDVEGIKAKFSRNLELQATKAKITQDPLTGLEQATNGAFAHLGPKASETLQTFARTQVEANRKALSSQIDDATERLLRGMPIDATIPKTISQAGAYGLSSKAAELRMLQELDAKAAGTNINGLRNARDKLEIDLARGNVDVSPSYADKLKKYFDGNIEAIQSDPLSYLETKAGSMYAPLTEITDFTKISPELLAQRQTRALQAESLLGTPAPSLKKNEIENFKNQAAGADANTQVTMLTNVRAMGDRSATALAQALEKDNPALAVAASSAVTDPNLVKQIVIGADRIRSGIGQTYKQEEWNSAATKAFAGYLDNDPAVARKYTEAAKALAAADPSLSPADAILKASNLISVDREGLMTGNYKTQAPVTGMTAKEFTNAIATNLATSADWRKYGNGVPASADGSPIVMDREDPTNFEFVSDGAGKYNVSRAGRKLITVDGKDFKVDLKSFMLPGGK